MIAGTSTQDSGPTRDTWIYRTPEFRLKHRDTPSGREYYLLPWTTNREFALNETAALVFEICRKPILLSEFVQMLSESFPREPTVESQALDVLDEFHRIGAIGYHDESFRELRFSYDYKPEPGRQSARAVRLVEYCLGDFSNNIGPPCTEDIEYLQDESILLMKSGRDTAVLRGGVAFEVRDHKQILQALISQRASIPDGLTCWMIRGDSAGTRADPGQGLHISGMRYARDRHLVLVPTHNRSRYVGPMLAQQIVELHEECVPWDKKSDTAWWGGALTGNRWAEREPRTLTRKEVLAHYQDHPSDRIHLHLTFTPRYSLPLPPGVQERGDFTKRDAFRHKCLILLPGNDIASGSSWCFAGNSVVLMPKPQLEHILYFEMNPWEHYVPLENDPADILVKLHWVLENQDEARQIVANAHERLRWLSGPELQWACNEVLRRLTNPNRDQAP